MTISQSSAGNVLTITDTGSYATVSSRTLTIYDPNGNVLSVIDMGSSLTTTYDISLPQYLSFVLVVVDNTGSYSTTVNYLANGIYLVAYVNVISQLGCSCNCGSQQLIYADIAELYNSSSLRLALGGFGVAANNAILAAYNIIMGL